MVAVSSDTGTVNEFTVPVEQEEKISRIYDCLLSNLGINPLVIMVSWNWKGLSRHYSIPLCTMMMMSGFQGTISKD